MKKVIFVTTRNIVSMCGELNLISSRAAALLEDYDTETVFFSFANQNKEKNMSDVLNRFSTNYTFYNKKNPLLFIFAYKKFCRKVLSHIRENDYDCVIVSGIFYSNIAKQIKKVSNAKLIYDCHGTNDELIEFNPSFMKKVMYFYFNYREKQILKRADGIFAVTKDLKEHLCEKAKVKGDFYIVPCALNKRRISYDEALLYREKWRNHFGISDDETLFIYSGGVSPWQSIDDVYAVYKKYQKDFGNAKLLIMTPEPYEIKYTDVITASFSSETVGEALFAGDVACLLRSNCMTNRVAFPNKYLEYVQSNMVILTTPYLPCIAEDVTSENMGMLIKSIDDFDTSKLNTLLESRNKEQDFSVRKRIIEKYSYHNSLKSFADMLQNTSDK